MNYLKHVLIFIITICLFYSCNDDDSTMIDDEIDKSGNLRPTGASANELLAEDVFTKLILEVDYVEGYQPTEQSLDRLVNFLEERLNKSEGIEITTSEIPSPSLAPFSLSDLESVEDEHRNTYNDGNTLSVWVLFADGNYSQNEDVVGVAFRNTSAAIFQSNIQNNSGGIGQPSQAVVEESVLKHEFGHLLGLVSNGSPMQTDHQDAENGKHCDVEDCLMYYELETGDIFTNLLNATSSPDLDVQCINDLQANGGK